ncbi:MAG: ribosome biogenesis GTP-binding protein YihA/YsxC [Coriobacteriaceae bacterium]|nr:ribosome biogenesis GTP-binding protein YihA/YsxC [Coriobacteriaceae bacterium]
MNYQNACYSGSFGTSEQIPASVRPEVSFVGRSNVGKSSLLNKLLNRKALAKVSSSPGKTSTVNFFTVDDTIDLVDLPGYGYAKVGRAERERWDELINGYYEQYRYYALVVSLIDIRHEASALDEQMIEFLRACELPFIVALTKADKLAKSKLKQQEKALRGQLGLGAETEVIITSAVTGQGMDQLRRTIEDACA